MNIIPPRLQEASLASLMGGVVTDAKDLLRVKLR